MSQNRDSSTDSDIRLLLGNNQPTSSTSQSPSVASSNVLPTQFDLDGTGFYLTNPDDIRRTIELRAKLSLAHKKNEKRRSSIAAALEAERAKKAKMREEELQEEAEEKAFRAMINEAIARARNNAKEREMKEQKNKKAKKAPRKETRRAGKK
jgi:hypothetical protein